MSELTPREKELVAIGAAIGGNCVPCVEYHIPLARKIGMTDIQIVAAIELANKVKQVPARNVYEAALQLVSGGSSPEMNGPCSGVTDTTA
ncbi:MAG: carboxymuconolactone decarboxylase family protein [Nitrospirae bacterium]|nr:carboxymuconolactone decarboxylase family protein [Nitrospirota bacterium]